MAEARTSNKWAAAFRAAFPNTVPVLTGYLILGLAYGVLMKDKGYGVLWSGIMSAVCYGGSIQYLAITLLTTAFDPIQAFLLSFMVNARHIFYGISMLQKYRGMGAVKPWLIFSLSDETYSIVSCVDVPEGVSPKLFYFFVHTLDWFYWLAGTVLGAVVGGFIRFSTEGMDFALTALFIVLFVEQWKKPENRVSCLIGLASTAICLLIFGADSFVIPSMIGIAVMLGIWRKTPWC
jgi:4-azaleucine resistance transporter AzlC